MVGILRQGLLRVCPRRQRGGAALEFMLVLPAVMLVLLGMLVLANYLTTRYFLTSAVTNAARACSLFGVPNRNACVNVTFAANVPNYVQARCGALNPTTSFSNVPNSGGVRLLNVNVTCNYAPVIGGSFLVDQGIPLRQLQAKSSMAINQ